MFRVKICGIRDVSTAAFCCAAGADAIGLNFFPSSKRSISLAAARELVDAIDSGTLKVGLFVNQTVEFVESVIAELSLDVVQLHGDEPTEFLPALAKYSPTLQVLRAVRIAPENLEHAFQEIEEWSSCQGSGIVGGILLDPYVNQAYGGTGQCIDWDWLAGLNLPTDKPIILAGGLTPENVMQAIDTVNPTGVDVAGGVENEDGQKDQNLIQKFVQEALLALKRN